MLALKHEMLMRDLEQEQQAMPDPDAGLDDDIGDELLRLILTYVHEICMLRSVILYSLILRDGRRRSPRDARTTSAKNRSGGLVGRQYARPSRPAAHTRWAVGSRGDTLRINVRRPTEKLRQLETVWKAAVNAVHWRDSLRYEISRALAAARGSTGSSASRIDNRRGHGRRMPGFGPWLFFSNLETVRRVS